MRGSRTVLRRLVFAAIFAAVVLLTAGVGLANETEKRAEQADSLEQGIQELELSDQVTEIQEFLNRISADESGRGRFSFWELMKQLAAGNLSGMLREAGAGLNALLLSELERGSDLLLQVLVIAVMGAVFSNLSSVLRGGQLSDTGFFVTYMLLFVCLAGSFRESLAIAARVLEHILEFMRLLMPAYFMAAAFSGGSVSAAALCEGMMAAAALVQWLCSRVLLQAAALYVLLVLGSHAVKEAFLTRMADLAEQAVDWSLKSMLGLVLGFQLIQTMILPFADSLGQTGLRRLAEAIPGVGAGAGALAQLVLGSGILIKNSLGAAAVVVLALIALIPVLKLTLLIIMYQLVAAVMQPVCDRRMVSCVSGVSRGHQLLLRIVLWSLLLFVLVIAVTCMATNVSYFSA